MRIWICWREWRLKKPPDRKNEQSGERIKEGAAIGMDILVFAGQSNMAGRGEWEKAVSCPEEAGMEFRAIQSPDRLFPITEPFGKQENVVDGVNDLDKKRGGMVSAFVKRYYEVTGRTVMAISASEGGTSTCEWLKRLLPDAMQRLESGRRFAKEQKLPVEHTAVIWCQGETDADCRVTSEEHQENLRKIIAGFRKAGAEQFFVISIGHYNYKLHPQEEMEAALEHDSRYAGIRSAQEQVCEQDEGVFLAESFEPYLEQMKDHYHYHQEAYEQVGRDAAQKIAEILQTMKKNC